MEYSLIPRERHFRPVEASRWSSGGPSGGKLMACLQIHCRLHKGKYSNPNERVPYQLAPSRVSLSGACSTSYGINGPVPKQLRDCANVRVSGGSAVRNNTELELAPVGRVRSHCGSDVPCVLSQQSDTGACTTCPFWDPRVAEPQRDPNS